MSDFFLTASGRPGLRLHKLELFNWGTFDSSAGQVHTIRPEGRTSLLVGKNGSGKSTLTDALITLLVRPGIRNYNVAAGASQKRERNERTYIKGAFDHGTVEADGNRSATRYLRDTRGGLYSVLLGVFRDEDGGGLFTVAHILYLAADEQVNKVYAFAKEEKSIAGDLSGFASFERFRAQIEERGFEATTTFAQYEKWLVRATGFRSKAMDVFNQTVAVKDIQSLNGFIRDHMLERRDWREQVSRILSHFTQLSEAHRSLVEARQQRDLLVPVRKTGKEYTDIRTGLDELERIKRATGAWFQTQVVDRFSPLQTRQEEALAMAGQQQQQLEQSLEDAREKDRQLRNEIEEQGGDRLRQIPFEIRERERSAREGRNKAGQLQGWLSGMSYDGPEPTDEEGFSAMRQQLEKELVRWAQAREDFETRKVGLAVQRHSLDSELADLSREIESLSQRRSNLPDGLVETRRRLCGALHLAESDLPFAAELIAVKPDYREWEASIEMVLRGFAITLLVPDLHYREVSRFVDGNRLEDDRGRGMRLVYRRVARSALDPMEPASANDPSRLPLRLDYREGRPLVPWLRDEIARRFDYRCCETVAEFQETHGLAMTKERHIKSGADRHEKDDRSRAVDPSGFLLGWDNKEKLRLLRERYENEKSRVDQLDQEIDELAQAIGAHSAKIELTGRILEIMSYEEIDFASHEQAIAELRREKEALESGSEALQLLKERREVNLGEIRSLETRRDETTRQIDRIEREAREIEALLEKAGKRLAYWESLGQLEHFQESFDAVAGRFGESELTPQTIAAAERDFDHELDREIGEVREALDPLETRLRDRMGKFLGKFPRRSDELQASPEYLGSFLVLLEQIEREDLPRHESRFKERLNEKVTQEIGFLNGELRSEETQIKTSIAMLNEALKNLEYGRGTYMQLEPRSVADREIRDFQRQLHDCISDSFEGTDEANENRFKRIEKLIEELREETRWREKVTDVRRWFDFSADEVEAETGRTLHSYSDSSGRSGGEKAKLAFTILVAAIAYQYKIDPHRETSERFHFVVVDEMFSKVDDEHAEYALRLFQKFGLQLLIVAPLDAKAHITEDYVDYYLLATKDGKSSCSQVFTMTSGEYRELSAGGRE